MTDFVRVRYRLARFYEPHCQRSFNYKKRWTFTKFIRDSEI